jgi:MerR family transcriptional regulator/heat shock protein HspR
MSERSPRPGPRPEGGETSYRVEYRAELVCQLLRLSPATLRRYERHGLVAPRRAGRRRVYDEATLQRLRRLRRLTDDLGVNLAGAAIILRLVDELADLRGRMEESAT